jgi:hypothetical protein
VVARIVEALNDGSDHEDVIQPLVACLIQVEEALDQANAAIWDAHYGKGITVEYARKAGRDATDARDRIREVLRG